MMPELKANRSMNQQKVSGFMDYILKEQPGTSLVVTLKT